MSLDEGNEDSLVLIVGFIFIGSYGVICHLSDECDEKSEGLGVYFF